MRSTTEQATSQAGLGITRLHAQTTQNKPQGFGKPNHPQEHPEREFSLYCDYLRLTFPIEGRETVKELSDWLQGMTGEVIPWVNRPVFHEHHHWDDYGRSANGLAVHYRLPDRHKEVSGVMAITFPGDLIETIEPNKLLWIWYRLLTEYDARATRIDLALDDYNRILDIDLLEGYAKQGYLTRLRGWQPFAEYRGTKLVNRGIAFGSRDSEVYYRAYDVNLESKGEEKHVKLEGEFKRGRADVIFKEMMRIYDSVKHHRNAANLVFSAMMPTFFREDTGLIFREYKVDEKGEIDNRNRGREKIIPYWQSFINKVYGFFGSGNIELDLKVTRPKRTADRSINFLQRQCANAYSLIYHVFGKQTAESLILKPFEELPRTHKAMATQIQMEMQNAMQSTTDVAMQIRQSLQYLDDEELQIE